MPHQKAEYNCADLSSRPQLFPCSQTADHTYSVTWITSHRRAPQLRQPLDKCIRLRDDTCFVDERVLGSQTLLYAGT
jgi:hypothetical protein